jgi:hypothetical protein
MIRFDDDDINLRRHNSIEKHRRRRIEKNRFPKKCKCVVCGERFMCRSIEDYIRRQYYLGPDKKGDIRHVCWGCDLTNKVKVTATTLYQLIDAIPRAERDWQEIFPTDFRHALIPPRQRSNFGWRRFEQWHPEGVVLCGMSARSATGQDSQGLRDYSEGTRLLTKYGKYEFVYRQKAASVVRDVLINTSDLVDLWVRLTPPRNTVVASAKIAAGGRKRGRTVSLITRRLRLGRRNNGGGGTKPALNLIRQTRSGLPSESGGKRGGSPGQAAKLSVWEAPPSATLTLQGLRCAITNNGVLTPTTTDLAERCGGCVVSTCRTMPLRRGTA